MERDFPEILSALRHEKNLSQRKAASDLQISQALLSHYENGAREPGLSFLRRACDYYGVSADYILGRSENPNGPLSTAKAAGAFLNEMRGMIDKAQMALDEFSEGEIR